MKKQTSQTSTQSSWLDTIRESTPSIIKDNASRIVGAVKVLGSVAVIAKSKDTLFRMAGGFFILGYGVMTAFGNKKRKSKKKPYAKKMNPPQIKQGSAGI